MDTMEKNRQTVQEGLENRANKRKKAIIEAEHEVITIQMFRIVNANANDADVKRQMARNQIAIKRETNRRNKRIEMLKKQRKAALLNMGASTLAFAIAAVLYVIGVREIFYVIATSTLLLFVFIFNLCLLIKAQKKLNRKA